MDQRYAKIEKRYQYGTYSQKPEKLKKVYKNEVLA